MNDLEDRLATPPAPDVAGAIARAAARAEREGLVDIAYAQVDSPLGPLLAAGTDEGLVTLSYTDWAGGVDSILERLAERVSPNILEAPARLDAVRRQLDDYFEGRRRDFDVDIDWALTAGFTRKVLQATARIPFGAVSSYREVASEAGSPRAVRAAGNALGHNPIPIIVPCHRVLRTGGSLGGYTGGLEKKETLLRLEGVLI